jgi:hypothetical protein
MIQHRLERQMYIGMIEHSIWLLQLKVQVKLMFKVPWCRVSIISIYIDNTLKHIQEKQYKYLVIKCKIV